MSSQHSIVEPKTSGPNLRISVWQCAPLPVPGETGGDIDVVGTNLDRLEKAISAIYKTIDVFVTPEMFLSGYNLDAKTLRSRADAPGGRIAQRISKLAKQYDLAIVYGCAEVDSSGNLYNAARCVDNVGKHLATHYKSHLFGDFDRHTFTSGNGSVPVFDLLGWRMALLICYEIEFPELARRAALEGAQLLLVPTANMIEFDEVQNFLVPARAIENQIFVAYANYTGHEGDLHYGGLSEIVGPRGVRWSNTHREKEEVIRSELKLSAISEARSVFHYHRDRRPDLYHTR